MQREVLQQDGRNERIDSRFFFAAENFQAIIRDCLEGLKGARNISDDITVFAKTQEEHDLRLMNVPQRLRKKNITLNK